MDKRCIILRVVGHGMNLSVDERANIFVCCRIQLQQGVRRRNKFCLEYGSAQHRKLLIQMVVGVTHNQEKSLRFGNIISKCICR